MNILQTVQNTKYVQQPGVEPVLAPAYALLATVLVSPADDEDLNSTLNSKKEKIKHGDYTAAFNTLHLDEKQQENIFKKCLKVSPNGWN